MAYIRAHVARLRRRLTSPIRHAHDRRGGGAAPPGVPRPERRVRAAVRIDRRRARAAALHGRGEPRAGPARRRGGANPRGHPGAPRPRRRTGRGRRALVETIPPHAGFGAGTQLALAVALAASRAAGRPAPDPRAGAAARTRAALGDRRRGLRARRARHRRRAPAEDDGRTPAGEAEGPEPPPVIFQHPLPDDWRFVLATPRAAPGLSGPPERRAFETCRPWTPSGSAGSAASR